MKTWMKIVGAIIAMLSFVLAVTSGSRLELVFEIIGIVLAAVVFFVKPEDL